jgi:hypothetical protein
LPVMIVANCVSVSALMRSLFTDTALNRCFPSHNINNTRLCFNDSDWCTMPDYRISSGAEDEYLAEIHTTISKVCTNLVSRPPSPQNKRRRNNCSRRGFINVVMLAAFTTTPTQVVMDLVTLRGAQTTSSFRGQRCIHGPNETGAQPLSVLRNDDKDCSAFHKWQRVECKTHCS